MTKLEVIKIFEDFIGVVASNKRYVVGLLDSNNLVLSCSKENLVGSIYESCDSEPSVLLEIAVRGDTYGYLLVQGSEELDMISGLLLDSLTTRILYEIDEHQLDRKLSLDDEIIDHLINPDKVNMPHLINLIKKSKINQEIDRVAIVIKNKDAFSRQEITRLKLKKESSQIIYSMINKHTLLIFKDIQSSINSDIVEYEIHSFIRVLENWGLSDCTYFIGSLQNKLMKYNESYKHALWLTNMNFHSVNKVLNFKYYMKDYFYSFIDYSSMESVFSYYKENALGLDIAEMLEIVDSLYKNNFNISQTATSLFIHKNTLIYKIQKYEEAFSIDIRSSYEGKIVLEFISRYFQGLNQQRIVGLRHEK